MSRVQACLNTLPWREFSCKRAQLSLLKLPSAAENVKRKKSVENEHIDIFESVNNDYYLSLKTLLEDEV